MRSEPPLRGTPALVALTASYALRRPAALIAGARHALSAPLALAVAPVSVAWSAALAISGVVAAVRIGVKVRRAPVLRPQPELLADAAELTPVCTLVSDTHVPAPGRRPCELDADPAQWRGPLPSGEAVVAALDRVLDDIHRRAPRTVIWCGDTVDTGDGAEWSRWRAAIDRVPGLEHRLVPGNHDICLNRPFDEDHSLARRGRRERRYRQHGGALDGNPVVVPLGAATAVLLDSCRHRSTHVLSNAVGHFGNDQLAALAAALAGVRGPLLCIAHHHVWRAAQFLNPETWYDTAIDADRLMALLVAYRRRDPANHVLVCHGHRHTMAAGLVVDGDTSVAVVGLPSTTMGDKTTGPHDGLPRYAIAGLRADGRWAVAMRPVAR